MSACCHVTTPSRVLDNAECSVSAQEGRKDATIFYFFYFLRDVSICQSQIAAVPRIIPLHSVGAIHYSCFIIGRVCLQSVNGAGVKLTLVSK